MANIVQLNVLPGEPLDGTGKVCIHLFVQDEGGKFEEPYILHPVLDEDGKPIKQQVTARITKGRLACNPNRAFAPHTVGGVTIVTPRTDDPRAVNCPKCRATREYQTLMVAFGESVTLD